MLVIKTGDQFVFILKFDRKWTELVFGVRAIGQETERCSYDASDAKQKTRPLGELSDNFGRMSSGSDATLVAVRMSRCNNQENPL